MKESKKVKSSNYLWLAFDAFACLGGEYLLLLVEQLIYGTDLSEFTQNQYILHSLLTSVMWGILVFVLYLVSKRKYHYNYMLKGQQPSSKMILFAIVLVITGIVEMSFSWGGFKPFMEFKDKSILRILSQNIYYLFETSLSVSIVIFGQKFGEETFGRKKIPYGGIVLALTWGLVHLLSQNFATGVETVAFSIVYGLIYLCLRKNVKLTYILCACIFLL